MDSIVILSFSGRKHGNCSNISAEIERFYNRANVRSIRAADHFSPCGGCDYECLRQGEKCPRMDVAARRIMDDICESKAVYFIIPDHCGAPCANYYAFNERSVGWFDGDKEAMDRYMAVKKRFVIVSNSRNETFEEAMRQQTFEEPDVLYLASRSYGKRSIDGDLMSSDGARRDLEMFLRQYGL